MRRLAPVLLLAGVLVGVTVAARRRYDTPVGPALRQAAAEATEMVATVREAMAEREGQLRAALGLDVAPGTEPLDPRAARALLEDPAGAAAASP